MKILNPVGAVREAAERPLPVIESLTGRSLGILSNHWKSMDRMAQRMATRARERYGVGVVSLHDIPVNGPMTETVEQRILDECDAAIVGLAN